MSTTSYRTNPYPPPALYPKHRFTLTDRFTASRPRTIKTDLVWMDGQMVPFDQANRYFLNPTLPDGDSVFEGIRCYDTARGPAVFRLHEHMANFLASVDALGLGESRFSLEQLCQAVFWVIEGNGLSDCYVRPVLFLGGSLGLDWYDYRPMIGIAAWAWEPWHEARSGAHHKSDPLAQRSPTRSAFGEAVLWDQAGYGVEYSGDNLFVVRDGVLYTFPKADVPEGIPHDTVLTLAQDAGYRVVATHLTRDDLFAADELFVCDAMAEVTGVCVVDEEPVGYGEVGPVTRQMQAMVEDVVRGRNRRSLQWLEYVTTSPII